MGKVFGIISLVCAIVGFAMTPFSYFYMPIPFRILSTFLTPTIVGTGIVMGGIGIAKDDSKGLAIAGLVIASIAMMNFFAGTILSFTGITS